jgi:hypothetical protein
MVVHPETEDWTEDELILMGQLCSVGTPIEHVAKFLGREIGAVREKAAELRLAIKARHQLEITTSPPISPEISTAPHALAAPPGNPGSSS